MTMERLLDILKIEILGNPLEGWLIFLVVLPALIFGVRKSVKILCASLRALTQRTAAHFDDFVVEVCEKYISPMLYVGAFTLAVKPLVLHPEVDRAVHALMVAVLTFQGIRLLAAFTVYFVERTWLKRETKKGGTIASKSILTVLQIGIWAVGFVFLLDNLGFNVSAIVAGLGISGIAVALAAQTILGDLFNYFVILLDRPFQEGDFIVVGDLMGTIENIGVKTTRIRSIGGEEVIISNSNLTSSRIRNYRRMRRRRVEFGLFVNHETALDQLKKIPPMIGKIIEGVEGAQFDRAHFKEFSEKGFLIDTVYYVLDADFNKRMDVQQAINLAIKEGLDNEGIKFV